MKNAAAVVRPSKVAMAAGATLAAPERHAAPFDPDQRAVAIAPELLTDEQGARLWGISVRTFIELQGQPWFPAPVLLGPRLKRHIRSELLACVAAMPRQTERAEPAQLARARIESMKRRGVPL